MVGCLDDCFVIFVEIILDIQIYVDIEIGVWFVEIWVIVEGCFVIEVEGQVILRVYLFGCVDGVGLECGINFVVGECDSCIVQFVQDIIVQVWNMYVQVVEVFQ